MALKIWGTTRISVDVASFLVQLEIRGRYAVEPNITHIPLLLIEGEEGGHYSLHQPPHRMLVSAVIA